jgi:hypothetical protein
MNIAPDEFEDCKDCVVELNDWIVNRAEKMPPELAARLLISIGVSIAKVHSKGEADFFYEIYTAVCIGIEEFDNLYPWPSMDGEDE